MTKIIHILYHSPPEEAYPKAPEDGPPKSSNIGDNEYSLKIDEKPYWVGFFQNDFHAKLASASLRITEEYDLECWRPYKYIKQMYTRNVKGIKHRLFPSKNFKLGPYNLFEISPLLIRELLNEIKKNQVIVHFHGLHNSSTNYFLQKVSKLNIPIVITQRGGAYPSFFIGKRKWFANFLLIFKTVYEKLIFDAVDFFILQSKPSFDYFSNMYGKSKTIHLQDGLDFRTFKKLDKASSRKELGISEKSKVLLFVGKLNSYKGAENTFWAFKNLKTEDKSYELICVGTNPNDKLYNTMCDKPGITLIPRVDTKVLRKYYSAADIHLYPTDNKKLKNFAGISNANIESLASNTPILTSQLIHFVGSDKDKNKVGIQYETRETLPSQIKYMISNPSKYSQCRDVALKYYNIDTNAEKLIMLYRKIEKKYVIK